MLVACTQGSKVSFQLVYGIFSGTPTAAANLKALLQRLLAVSLHQPVPAVTIMQAQKQRGAVAHTFTYKPTRGHDVDQDMKGRSLPCLKPICPDT